MGVPMGVGGVIVQHSHIHTLSQIRIAAQPAAVTNKLRAGPPQVTLTLTLTLTLNLNLNLTPNPTAGDHISPRGPNP